MARKHLFVGISLAALTAGTAAAQTTTDANGNTESRQCAPGNSCDVDNQVAGNDRNRGFIRQTGGTGNFGLITQRGDDNSSTIEQNGNDNSATHNQVGDDHRSRTTQTGDDNASTINQGDEDNSATVTQVHVGSGPANSSYVRQGYDDEFSTDLGENNVVTVSQNGSALNAAIYQTRNGNTSADDNRATLVQTGTGSVATIFQLSRGNSATVRLSEGGLNNGGGDNSTNQAVVLQFNPFFRSDGQGGFVQGAPDDTNNPLSENAADVAIRGRQNVAVAYQLGVQNTVVVSMLGGGPGQVQPGQTGPSGQPLPEGRSEGNTGVAIQYGRKNYFEISAGGLGGAGNVTQGQQQGFAGGGHRATVYQRGILDNFSFIQVDNSGSVVSNTGGSPAAMPGSQDGSIIDISQLSFNSSTSISQSGTNTAIVTQGANRTESGGDNNINISQDDLGDTDASGSGGVFTPGTSNTTRQRNFAEVTQYGIGNSTSVQQSAINARAVVFQTLGSRQNRVNIEQGTGNGLASGASAASGPANLTLTANVTQSGRGSSVTIGQSGQFLSATVNQTGTVTTSAGSANVVTLSQVADNSIANVSQNGFGLNATIDQRGNGTSTNPNRVTVTQAGDAHTANAVQESTSGASPSTSTAATNTGGNTAAFPRARSAGANSAEIEIMQSGSISTATAAGMVGNSATVRQQGLGQLGIITQAGRNNVAGILQGSGATNAVAIIEQTGNSNTFFITQTTAGQYMRVTQTGAGNVSTTSASGGTPAGGTGTGGTTGTVTPPAGF
jgi:hypothetical protein